LSRGLEICVGAGSNFLYPTFCRFDEPLTPGANCRTSGRLWSPGGDFGGSRGYGRYGRYGNEPNEARFPQDYRGYKKENGNFLNTVKRNIIQNAGNYVIEMV